MTNRKPDPKFYMLACDRNDLKPNEVVFLDDIPENIKAAKALGMDTIRVYIGYTLQAVKALEEKIGIDLTNSNRHVTPLASTAKL
jgi:FMN phosphatase YigB (HAD superfamily)